MVETGAKLRIVGTSDKNTGVDGGESGEFVRSMISIGIFEGS